MRNNFQTNERARLEQYAFQGFKNEVLDTIFQSPLSDHIPDAEIEEIERTVLDQARLLISALKDESLRDQRRMNIHINDSAGEVRALLRAARERRWAKRK